MRYLTSPGPLEVRHMEQRELRTHFLVDGLFAPGKMEFVYSGLDRLVVGGITPQPELRLPNLEELASDCFTERREVGVINIGAPGEVEVGDRKFCLGTLDCLYIGIEEPDVVFRTNTGGQAEFYLLSAPAHKKLPTCAASAAEANVRPIGDQSSASRRRLVQHIHEGGIQSCQLVMGYTKLEEGSVWNTWPPHTHFRRSEIYLYFDLGNNPLIHLLGEASESRHIVVRDREVVLSPPWSIHTGVGTGPYTFVWGMAGENKNFADMHPVDLAAFR